MGLGRRWVQVPAVALAVVLAAAGCGSATPTPTASPDTRPADPLGTRIRVPEFGPDVVAATQEALAREGVATIAGASVTAGAPGAPLAPLTGAPSPLQVLDDQARAMALDAWSGAGIEGSELDAQVVVPDGAAPPSLLLAAYVDLGYTPDATPGARLAANLVGRVEGAQAAETSYPLLVMALLTADLAGAAPQTNDPQVRLASITDAPCTTVTNFFDNALTAVFNAVKSSSSSFPAQLWNVVVSIGQGVVTGLIKAFTAPVLDAVAKIIGVVAVVVQVVSLLRPWTLKIAADDQHTRFSVGGESLIDDPVRLSVDLGGADRWPGVLENCANAARFTLPNLLPEGAPVKWKPLQFPDPLFPVMPLVTVAPTSTLNDALGVNGATTLRLQTGHEASDKGDLHVGLVRVFATVQRPGLDTFKQQITGIVLNGLPPIVASALAGVIAAPLDTAVNKLASLTSESGVADFAVSYHEPEATPGPTIEPTGPPSQRPTVRPSPRPSIKPKGGPDPCASGCGESEGDPHLQTVSGQEYDFQAAGEYTLLRSADGSMEIQGRQVPYPGVPDVSINTAFAWRVAGHRVGVYSTENGYELTIDGAPAGPDVGTLDLGGGASLTALADGVEVAYPDGTISTTVAHGGGFEGALDIEIAPSDSLRTQGVVGLLAPIADGSELPAMPDGTVLPLAADRGTRYHQRYELFGPAWHVTPATSLFDYATGESTATFDVPGFPSPNVAFDIGELEARMATEAVEQAAEQCAGVGNQRLAIRCIFDVLATNNPSFALVYQLLDRFLTEGPDGLERCRRPDQPPGFSVSPCIDSLIGEALGPDGTLYATVTMGAAQQLVAIDPASGNITRSLGFQNVGHVGLLANSLWVVSAHLVNESGTCQLRRLDPATFERQATIDLPCPDTGGLPELVIGRYVAWVTDGTEVRPVDVSSNALGNAVTLPISSGSGGTLVATDDVLYQEDIGADPGHWYRLGLGETAFTDLGVLPGFGDAIPGGGGLWIDAADGSGEQHFTTTGTSPDATVAIDGVLAAADDQALYVARDDSSINHSELWRYPIAGGQPSLIAQNDVEIPLLVGSMALAYSAALPSYTLTDGRLGVTWLAAQGTSSVLYLQSIALPQ